MPRDANRRADARRNRAVILTAATRQLARDDDLSMHGVAMEAGVSRSTLYRHFPSRSDLTRALRYEALDDARRAIGAALSESRPPLALLRRTIAALVDVALERRLGAIDMLRLDGDRTQELGDELVPLIQRLRRLTEVSPSPPAEWLREASAHFIEVCLERATASSSGSKDTTDELFRSITEPLDRGLVLLDAHGSLLALNPPAELALSPQGGIEIGRRLTEPLVDVLFEDGSACPPDAYPLGRAVRTQESQDHVIRGHVDPSGTIRWVAVEARVLVRPGTDAVYGVVGILTDVTAERGWELERLRPAGELGRAQALPLDIVRVLDEIPPHLFPEQFVSEASKAAGVPIALYVVDIDGSHVLRLAGADEFPARLDAPLALGPELADDGIPALVARIESELPGVATAPMWLRGRVVGLLLALHPREDLDDLARLGAAAMELAGGYTDVFDAARRRKETTAAAELQQSLLPPRIARIGGGVLAGSVLPSYEVGGDWFDYVENRDGAWVAVADAVGKGPTAAALGSIALAALRAARRDDQGLEAAAQTMHEAIHDVSRPEFFVTAIIARWHAVYSTFSWINCGHPPPLVVLPDNRIEQLRTESNLPLGLFERERRFSRHQRRLDDGELLILHSDGVTARRTPDGLFGLDGLELAIGRASTRSATAIARSVQEAVLSAAEDPLQDDAVAVVLAPARDAR